MDYGHMVVLFVLGTVENDPLEDSGLKSGSLEKHGALFACDGWQSMDIHCKRSLNYRRNEHWENFVGVECWTETAGIKF